MNGSLRSCTWRLYLIWVVFFLLLLGLVWRLIDLTVFNRSFLVSQGQQRIVRHMNIPVHRGIITDRNGEALAISIPVVSVWVNPSLFHANAQQIKKLTHLLGMTPAMLHAKIVHGKAHSFVYLKRQNLLSIGQQVTALKIPGIFLQQEFKRFYPQGKVSAHLVGFTNVDDQGQEGLELAYNRWLQGVAGRKDVIKDRLGNIIADITLNKKNQPGHSLMLSIDQRIQYLAYHYLQQTVQQFHAVSGSIVVLDVNTGEILAIVNLPSYDPNHRHGGPDVNGRYRNRAITDTFEPGSTIKPFTIALALMSKRYTVNSRIDTSPGQMRVGGFLIHDEEGNNGVLNLTQILEKSSNIGAAKIMLSLSPKSFWQLLNHFGFGRLAGTGFPGEAYGHLQEEHTWRPSVVAALAYGYGISVTALQLAHAYAILANHGIDKPITLLKASTEDTQKNAAPERIIPENISTEVLQMLEQVVQVGTGKQAQIDGYRVAGKTGTSYIASGHGYDRQHYNSSFVGIAPASHPRLVAAVVIRDPHGAHFGAYVAAPLFAKVMGDALRLLNIPPDAIHIIPRGLPRVKSNGGILKGEKRSSPP